MTESLPSFDSHLSFRRPLLWTRPVDTTVLNLPLVIAHQYQRLVDKDSALSVQSEQIHPGRDSSKDEAIMLSECYGTRSEKHFRRLTYRRKYSLHGKRPSMNDRGTLIEQHLSRQKSHIISSPIMSNHLHNPRIRQRLRHTDNRANDQRLRVEMRRHHSMIRPNANTIQGRGGQFHPHPVFQ